MERILQKALAGHQDLALGQGDAEQTRNGLPVSVTQVDLPFVFTTLEKVQSLDTAKYKHCYLDTGTQVLLYRFDAVSEEVADNYDYIDPTAGTGQWVLVQDVKDTEEWKRAVKAKPLQVPDYATLIANAAQYADGDVVEVVRRQAGQEGGGTFVIFEADLSAEAANDPQQGVYIELVAGSKYAVRRWDGYYNVTWWGTTGDGLTNDTPAISAANVHIGNHLGGGTLFFPVPADNYRIESEIFVPVEVNWLGSSRRTYFAVRAGSYPNGAAILSNTTNGTDWVVSNPNNRSSVFDNLRIETDDTSLTCFKFSGSPVFKNISFKFWNQSIVGSNQFNDLVRVEMCTFSHSTTAHDWQIDLGNTGDGVLIKQAHFFNVANDPAQPMNAIKAVNNAVSIENSLTGNMELVNCSALSSIRNCGTDGGKWVLDKSHMTFENCGLTQLELESALELRNDTSFTYTVTLDQFTFTHDLVRDAWEPYRYDIKTANGFNVEFRNTYKSVIVSTDPRNRNLFGVQVENEVGTALAAFNDYSHFYSRSGSIEDQKVFRGFVDHRLPQLSLTLFKVLAPFASAAWKGATDTYYYRVVPYWDVARSVSRSDGGGEKSIALTNGGSAAILEIGDSNYSGNMIVRVYRGLSAGSYDNFADVPVVDTPALIDNGTAISGIAWQSRTAGAISPVNVLNLGGMQISRGLISIRSTAPPTIGTWAIGDEVENTALSIDGNGMVLEGWKRITSGSSHVLGTDWARRYISDVTPAT